MIGQIYLEVTSMKNLFIPYLQISRRAPHTNGGVERTSQDTRRSRSPIRAATRRVRDRTKFLIEFIHTIGEETTIYKQDCVYIGIVAAVLIT